MEEDKNTSPTDLFDNDPPLKEAGRSGSRDINSIRMALTTGHSSAHKLRSRPAPIRRGKDHQLARGHLKKSPEQHENDRISKYASYFKDNAILPIPVFHSNRPENMETGRY